MAEELVTRRVGRVLIGRRGHVVEVRAGEAPIGFWRVMGYVSLLMVILLGLLVVGCVARTGGWSAWGEFLFCVYIALPAVATMVWCVSRLEELLSGSRGFWMRASPAGVVYRSMAASHFLSPSNVVDIEVRKYGAFEPWHLVAHSERLRHHRQFILSSSSAGRVPRWRPWPRRCGRAWACPRTRSAARSTGGAWR